MPSTTDLVAFSGLQVLEKVPSGGPTLNTDMLAAFDTALLAAGWTKIVDGCYGQDLHQPEEPMVSDCRA